MKTLNDYRIVLADEGHMTEIERWLDAEQASYSSASEAWDASDDDVPRPVRGFRCNWDSVKNRWRLGSPVFTLLVEDTTIGFLDGTDILEINPNWRGMGYGRILAEFMLQREFDVGRTVITIGIAPFSAEPFWRLAMGFTVLPDRTWYGGGTFAYRVLRRAFPLGAGPRAPYSVKFYTEEQGYAPNRVPFASFTGLGERLADGSIQLPERAYCFDENVEHHQDYFVAIEVDGLPLVLDKAKREECARLGVQKDNGEIFFVDVIHPRG